MRGKNYLEYLNQDSEVNYFTNIMTYFYNFDVKHAKQILAAEKLQSQFKTYGIR